jgi:chemotaxis protein CheD
MPAAPVSKHAPRRALSVAAEPAAPLLARFVTQGDGHEAAERRTLFLQPGQLVVSSTPCIVTTIVGSCVAVCLRDRLLKIGGLNHYLLPHKVLKEHSARFGAVAIPELIGKLVALGCQTDRLEAKLFGGACVLGPADARAGHLGSKNVQLARELLQQAGIRIVAEDVEGFRGRKLIYHTDDGTAWIRRL